MASLHYLAANFVSSLALALQGDGFASEAGLLNSAMLVYLVIQTIRLNRLFTIHNSLIKSLPCLVQRNKKKKENRKCKELPSMATRNLAP